MKIAPSLARLAPILRVGCAVAAILIALGLLVRQPVLTSLAYRPALRSDAGALRRHVTYLCDQASPRDSDHPENLDQAAAYLGRELAASGARVTEQTYSVRGKTYRNVIASLGPRSGRPLIVGAHYDSFGDFGPNPGADDNASGTAGLLEIARLVGGQDLRRPVEIVAYSTEEPPFFASPHMGSAVHARSLRAAGRVPTGMICLEMIGCFTKRQPWPSALLRLLFPNDGQFIAVVGRWPDRSLARNLKRAFRGAGGVTAVSYSGPAIAGSDASDHRSYWNEWAEGIPAVMVTDTAFLRNPRYHSPQDGPGTLDYRRMAQVVDGVANAVLWQAGPG